MDARMSYDSNMAFYCNPVEYTMCENSLDVSVPRLDLDSLISDSDSSTIRVSTPRVPRIPSGGEQDSSRSELLSTTIVNGYSEIYSVVLHGLFSSENLQSNKDDDISPFLHWKDQFHSLLDEDFEISYDSWCLSLLYGRSDGCHKNLYYNSSRGIDYSYFQRERSINDTSYGIDEMPSFELYDPNTCVAVNRAPKSFMVGSSIEDSMSSRLNSPLSRGTTVSAITSFSDYSVDTYLIVNEHVNEDPDMVLNDIRQLYENSHMTSTIPSITQRNRETIDDMVLNDIRQLYENSYMTSTIPRITQRIRETIEALEHTQLHELLGKVNSFDEIEAVRTKRIAKEIYDVKIADLKERRNLLRKELREARRSLPTYARMMPCLGIHENLIEDLRIAEDDIVKAKIHASRWKLVFQMRNGNLGCWQSFKIFGLKIVRAFT